MGMTKGARGGGLTITVFMITMCFAVWSSWVIRYETVMVIMTDKTFPKILSSRAVIILVFLFVIQRPAWGCFTIVVGKDASADGCVIMAHNEDDPAPQIVNHYKMPRKKYSAGEKVKLLNGGELEQVDETWSYIWSEMPGMRFSDSYINEWGVGITSDGCDSRQDRPEITDGGIGFMLRKIVAQRAKNAREGVLLAGELVERFGYTDSGRTYAICDPDEGWIFCVINGKHWLAKRVPDEQVAFIANAFSVHDVDLADTDHFLACDDIIEYAVSRGWYDREKDGSFDFANVYARPESLANPSNFQRQWAGLRYVAAGPIAPGRELPCSIVPKERIDVATIMKILRDHYEGTKLESGSKTISPHKNPCTICCGMTQTSFVAQFRRDMPGDIGIVYWVSLAPPCTSCYIPFHFGISQFPRGFCSSQKRRPTRRYYQKKVGASFRANIFDGFWTFSNFYNKIDTDYWNKINDVKREVGKIERRSLVMQKSLEAAARRVYPKDKTAAMELLGNYSDGLYLSAIEAMETVLIQK